MHASVLRLLFGLYLFALCVPSALAQQQRPRIERADLGFADRYKVGCWTPLRLELKGGSKTLSVVAEVHVPDSDGLSTAITSAPISLPAGEIKVSELLVRIGQLDSPVEVELMNAENGKTVASRKFTTFRDLDKGGVVSGEPATARLVLEVGPSQLGTASTDAAEKTQGWYTRNVIGRVADLSRLPRDWLAYEGVDTVLLSTSDRETWITLRPDDPRIRALSEWVAMGGRLVLFCGRNSSDVLGSGGALVDLTPGLFVDMATVDDLKRLENFVGGNEPLPGRGQLQLSVPRLDSVHGDVELKLGSGETSLPLVVRTRYGLGNVVFVALDVDESPLRNWKSRDLFVKKLLAFDNDANPTDDDYSYYGSPSDLAATLAQRLDQELESSGIKTPPFLAIAGLVVLYILLIGPGDFLFVKHVLRRMEATWITFPLIVLATCLAAYWYADYLKGDDLRINQVELVDVDCTTGLARGTMWTHVFSPSPDRYSLQLRARTPAGEVVEPEGAAMAWFGRPGEGLGGMNAQASSQMGWPVYSWSTDRSQLRQTPIEVWSTKTFVTRWHGRMMGKSGADTVEASLTRNASGGVEGKLVNRAGVDLSHCKLVCDDWAWSIGDLPAGGTATIEPPGAASSTNRPRKLRTLFERDHSYVSGKGSYYEQQALLRSVELKGLVEMMMFHDALGGRRKNNQWNRSQQFVDLSRALDGDTAMLIGQAQVPRSELMRTGADGEPQSMRGEKDLYLVFYRFVFPISDAN